MDTFQQVFELISNLTPLERIRLVEKVMATLERDLSGETSTPRKSLYGLWSDLDIPAEEIDQARQEMWGNFPREDI